MDFKVRDRTFKINFVNNYCREQYQAMLDTVDDLADLPLEIEEITEDKKLSDKEAISKLRDIKKRKRELVKQTVDIREDIMTELLTTNNYEYDRNWWLRKTTANDINDFVLGCLQKDLTGKGSKKK